MLAMSSVNYNEALKKRNAVNKKLEKENANLKAAEANLKRARDNMLVIKECRGCGHSQKANETIMSEETKSTGWQDSDYYRKRTWFCNGCGLEYNNFESKVFPNGIMSHCKEVICWSGYENKRVKELRSADRERFKAKIEALDRERKIKAAKKLLQEEGILKWK
jgi:hypothetical protein